MRHADLLPGGKLDKIDIPASNTGNNDPSEGYNRKFNRAESDYPRACDETKEDLAYGYELDVISICESGELNEAEISACWGASEDPTDVDLKKDRTKERAFNTSSRKTYTSDLISKKANSRLKVPFFPIKIITYYRYSFNPMKSLSNIVRTDSFQTLKIIF